MEVQGEENGEAGEIGSMGRVRGKRECMREKSKRTRTWWVHAEFSSMASCR